MKKVRTPKRTGNLVIPAVIHLDGLHSVYINWVADKLQHERPGIDAYTLRLAVANAIGVTERTIYNLIRSGKVADPTNRLYTFSHTKPFIGNGK